MTVNIRAATRPAQVFSAVFGRNGAGTMPLPGATVGATILAVINVVTGANASASFAASVTVNGQLALTSASNLSTQEFDIVVQHP
jgi:hypothetical protein